jgi:molecular chaperone GrpE
MIQDNKKRAKNNDADIAEAAINESGSETMNTDPVIDNALEEITETVSDIDKLKEELAASKDKYIRLFAEFENYKRRNAKERIELIQTAGKDVITSLLSVLDDCDRAEKQINNSEDINQLKEGVLLVFNKLRTTLQSKGLISMESKDTNFDVEKHEAIAEIEVPEKALMGKVIDEVEKGYYLNNKLIRFAKVIVGKNSPGQIED